MSKYYLIASYYNLHTNTYQNETIIESIKGKKLNTLAQIDDLTSNNTSTELFKLIEEETNKTGFNHLSIMYLKNKTSLPTYYRIIENDKLFNNCLNTSKQVTNFILGKQKTTLYINRNNELYREELVNLLTIIETKNYSLFKSIYPYNNDFSFLVERYMNTSYDNELSKEEDLNQILLEFSRYKTFRGWYLNHNKKKTILSSKNNKNKEIPPKIKLEKTIIPTIKENEEAYEKRFKNEYGISVKSYNTSKFNIDNEEFLSEEEYDSMNNYEEDNLHLGRRH